MARPSERLKKYDSVLTIKTSVGLVPVYKFIEKFLWIQDKEGNRIRFILNNDQCSLYEEMCKQRLQGQPVRIDILKARQKGFSTFIAAVIFVETIFNKGRSACIVADIAEHASNLFQKYIYFYDNLPDELKPEKIKSNAKELVVKYGDGQRSSIRITVQGDSAGRSGTYQYLHLSECAFWDNLKSTLTSLLQTVSNTNVDSMIFLETTANGVNDYKSRWDRDVTGGTAYKALFYGWNTTEDYQVKPEHLKNYLKPNWLIDYQMEYRLTECQCQWIYDKFEEFDEDLSLLRQEFPINPVEAFVTSGNSVYNSEATRKRKEELLKDITEKKFKVGFFEYTSKTSLDGKRIEVSGISFIESRNGSVRIYEDVDITHPYVIVNDPASGGEDYFATEVWDNFTGHQVAVYHKNKCDIDDCVYQMYCLGKYYNFAMATGETNTTSYILEQLHKMGYPKIYQDQDVEDLDVRYINKYGYKTKQNNRQYMIDLSKMAFRDNPKIINDYDTICEMESFQIVSHKTQNGVKEKSEASGGAHDDLVMAMCGFYLCRGAQTTIPKNIQKSKNLTYGELEYRVEENRRKNSMKNNQRRNVYQLWD